MLVKGALYSAKPLLKPMLVCCQFNSQEQSSMKYNQNEKKNASMKYIQRCFGVKIFTKDTPYLALKG